MPANKPIIATPSRTETTARCYRRHAISDLAWMQRKGLNQPPLAFGTVIHSGAANRWLSDDFNTMITAAHQEYFNEENYPHLVDNDKHTFPLVENMLTKYYKEAKLAGGHHSQELEKWKILEIENRCELPLEHGLLSFQMDRLLKHTELEDEYVLVDTKTASRLDQRWRAQWDRSLQMKLYCYGIWKKYGHLATIYIEGLLKTNKSEIEYVKLPRWSVEELEEAAALVDFYLALDESYLDESGGDLQKLLHLLLTQSPFNPSDCFAYYTACPLLDCCSSPPDQRVSLLMSDFEPFVPKFAE